MFLLKTWSVAPVDQKIKLVWPYKKKVNSIFVDKEVAFSLNTETCECEHSQFCDLHHKYIITADFRIIDHCKLKKLMTRGSNYRESSNLRFIKVFDNINSAIDNSIQD